MILERYGTQAAFARSVGITRMALSNMLRRDRVSRKVLDALGLERGPVEYRRKQP